MVEIKALNSMSDEDIKQTKVEHNDKVDQLNKEIDRLMAEKAQVTGHWNAVDQGHQAEMEQWWRDKEQMGKCFQKLKTQKAELVQDINRLTTDNDELMLSGTLMLRNGLPTVSCTKLRSRHCKHLSKFAKTTSIWWRGNLHLNGLSGESQQPVTIYRKRRWNNVP